MKEGPNIPSPKAEDNTDRMSYHPVRLYIYIYIYILYWFIRRDEAKKVDI